jgi:phosphoribosylanthranilate isomerase
MTRVKICGLTTAETVDAALDAGADYLGFVLFPKSPRALTAEQAAALIGRARGRARTVALLVDPDDGLLDAVAALGPDLIQLHGRETPERVAEARARTGRPVIKALPVGSAADLEAAQAYSAADHLMFDAQPPTTADRPGGHGATFDWGLLASAAPHPPGPAGRAPPSPQPGRGEDAPPCTPPPGRGEGGARPAQPGGRVRGDALWFLAGGLTPANVGEALRITRAPVADVSSGVESSPGVKDPALIAAFIRAVRDAA